MLIDRRLQVWQEEFVCVNAGYPLYPLSCGKPSRMICIYAFSHGHALSPPIANLADPLWGILKFVRMNGFKTLNIIET